MAWRKKNGFGRGVLTPPAQRSERPMYAGPPGVRPDVPPASLQWRMTAARLFSPMYGGPLIRVVLYAVAGHNSLYSNCSGAASVYSAVASLSINFRSLDLIGIDLALVL